MFVGQTFPGRTHDYTIPVRGKPSQGTLLKAEFPPEEAWFVATDVLLDLGYDRRKSLWDQGIQTDYEGKAIRLPHKKPRKSKKKPDSHLSSEQKQQNRALAKLRVFVEHAIGGIKRFRVLVAPYRNHRDGFEDDVLVVAAGLWNFWLT